MTESLALEVTARPSAADRHAVGRGLGAYNREAYGRLRGSARWILARDTAGTVQAGAKCELAWGWLYVDWLWVAEGLRRQGLGGRLLAAAEALARGLPVAITAGGAIAEVVPVEAGCISPPGDVMLLTRAMRRVLFDTGMRADMAEAAWQAGQRLPRWRDRAAAFLHELERARGGEG